MRQVLLIIALVVISGCGGSRPVDGGYTASVAKPKVTATERLTAAQAAYQRGLRWYADQDNSCNKPSQWFPAANCVLSAAQLKNLETNIMDAGGKLNAAIREHNAWVERGSVAGDDKAFVQALIIAENAIAQFKVPDSFIAP